MSYSPILLNPEDAQFIANQSWSVTQVARLFGIPVIWMAAGVDGTSLTYTNMEDLNRSFITTTLVAYLAPIEQMFTDLTPRGQVARFKLDALLRSDLMTRVQAYEKFVAMGVMTADEVRASEGMFPSDSGPGFIPPPHNDGSPT
jgi:HK97 family phage portal protein